MKKETINLLFGLKIRILRQQQGLTFQQLADKAGTTISFLHDIEKGKKRPSTDKIFALAKALDTTYDYLVAVQGAKKLQPIVDLLESDFFKQYPVDLFGLEPAKIIELLAAEPEKVNAFISTVLKIAKSHHVSRENLYSVALRSYQDLHDNYFDDLELAAKVVRSDIEKFGVVTNIEDLEQYLGEKWEIKVNRQTMTTQKQLKQLRSFYSENQKILFLNKNLSTAQEKFLLGREIAFQHLAMQNRPFEMMLLRANSFEKLLNNFRASYFSSALLMDENELLKDIRHLAEQLEYKASDWLQFLQKYDVTPEMLLQRLTNVLPRHFGIRDLFFIRLSGDATLSRFEMTKELHLSGQQSPYATEREEHYCRRWISIRVLRNLRAKASEKADNSAIVDAQISQYWQTENTYFCLSFAKPNNNNHKEGTSVTLGLLLNDNLRRTFKFIDDPNLLTKIVNTTCETCSIPDCGARVAAPIVLEKEQEIAAMEAALEALKG